MDVGTVQSPVANIAMPGQKAGTPVPAMENRPIAPMQAQAVEAKQKIAETAAQDKVERKRTRRKHGRIAKQVYGFDDGGHPVFDAPKVKPVDGTVG